MDSWVYFCVVFVCIAGGVLFGWLLRRALPGHHLSEDTKDVVRLGTGLIATIAALVLGLLIASAKTSFDMRNTQVKQLIANVILIDGFLTAYGAEAATARALLRHDVQGMAAQIWNEQAAGPSKAPYVVSQGAFAFYDALVELAPGNGAQESPKSRAIQASTELAKARLLLFADADNPIPMLFLAVLIFWLTIIFASFSLFAQPNGLAMGFLFVCGLSAAGAIYLIVELGHPFNGAMQISSAPLRHSLVPLSP